MRNDTNGSHPSPPRTAGRGRARLVPRLLLPVVALAVLAAAPREVGAEGCDGCSGPTLAYLQQNVGLSLQMRGDSWSGYARDHLLTDAGECTATLVEPPEITRESAWLVLRGTGEVWNCPHSKSEDTITAEASQTDSSAWSLKATSGIKARGLVAEVKLEVEQGRSGGVEVREVTRISKTITPGYCRRIGWWGYFEVASYKAEAKFKFTQRWAWWTKNRKTGAAVHASGDVQMDCGTGTVELGRNAPIAGFFDLAQGACEAAECAWVVPKLLGFFPPLPPYLPNPRGEDPAESPPTTTEDDEEDGPEPDEPLPVPPSPEDLGEPPAGPLPVPPSSEDLGEPPSGPLPDPLAN